MTQDLEHTCRGQSLHQMLRYCEGTGGTQVLKFDSIHPLVCEKSVRASDETLLQTRMSPRLKDFRQGA